MKESDVRKKLSQEFRLHGAHVSPIENSVGVGIPDLNVCFQGKDFWIELKYKPDCPKRDKTPAMRGMMRPDQIVWFKQRLKAGATNLYIFLRLDNELFLLQILSVEDIDELEHISVQEVYEKSLWYGIIRKSPDYLDLLNIML